MQVAAIRTRTCEDMHSSGDVDLSLILHPEWGKMTSSLSCPRQMDMCGGLQSSAVFSFLVVSSHLKVSRLVRSVLRALLQPPSCTSGLETPPNGLDGLKLSLSHEGKSNTVAETVGFI